MQRGRRKLDHPGSGCPGPDVYPRKGRSKWGVAATAKTNWFMLRCREKSLHGVPSVPVPQPDTGRQGENPKAFERTPVKELGKIAP